MSIRTRNIHFTNWAKVIEALADKGVTVADESAARTFLTDTSSDANPYYYYVGYIKDTQEIYTHGKFYKGSDSLYDDTELRDLIGIKADLSALEALASEVEENELVTTKALYDLNDRKLDRSELDNMDLSNYVDVETYNSDLDSINASITNKANQSDLVALSAEVEENEEVTAAALTELHENKADKSEIPDVSTFATKDELNTLNTEVEEKVDSTTFTTLSETVAGHTTSITNLESNKADKTDLDDYATTDDLNTKQDLLTSGTNIKTVNGNSLLGSGNIETHDTKVTSADNHYGYNSNNATSTTGAFVTKITKDEANHVTSFESRALTATDIPSLDASKITSGTISIERLPSGALERMFVVESETAAMSATVQEGDVVQVTGNNNKMYFCISNTATTFATKFKEFTAGTATSVAWSGITGKPDLATQEELNVVDAKFANYLSLSGGTMTGSITTRSNIYSWANAKSVGHIKAGHTPGVSFAPIISTGLQSGGYGKLGQVNDNFGLYSYSAESTSPILRIELCPEAGYINILGPTYPAVQSTYDLGASDRKWKNVYADTFIGNLTGNVTGNVSGSSGSCTGNAASATTVRINNAASNVLCPLVFVSNTTAGNKDLFVSTGKSLTFNPSTGDLSAKNFIGTLTGNADSAIKLANARTIWGQSFDGTGNIDGEIRSTNTSNDAGLKAYGAVGSIFFGVGSSGTNRGIYDLTNDHWMLIRDASTNIYFPNGNIGIGGTTADEKLHINGNVKASGSMYAVDFETTSDNRLKDFVSDIHVDFESLKQIPKKYYYWKDKSMGEDLQLGTSAQELAKVYPECVHYDETNDRYSVNYQKLSIVALAAIDKLHDRISELESKLYD